MDNNQFKVFVGGISWDTTEEGLKEFMGQAGEVVEAKIIKDKFSGRSKGFGFVTFADEAGMKKAIEELNGKELDGRQLKVAEAQPPKPRE
ncbi:MAG: RNA-binding protein [Candidatus Dojkabacteria bacterium]|nr:RNA-binding protein [Candidatus Dojkabacteria bacterium]